MGKRLRQLRKSKKLTQKQAADRIGIANTLYNKQYCYPIHLNGVKQQVKRKSKKYLLTFLLMLMGNLILQYRKEFTIGLKNTIQLRQV